MKKLEHGEQINLVTSTEEHLQGQPDAEILPDHEQLVPSEPSHATSALELIAPTLTSEQLERMERNRLLALEKRKLREQAQQTPTFNEDLLE